MVSSSDTESASRERDYGQKRKEYAQREIPEYWIVDAIAAQILVLQLRNGRYQEQQFVGEDQIVSAAVPTLALTAAQILRAQL